MDVARQIQAYFRLLGLKTKLRINHNIAIFPPYNITLMKWGDDQYELWISNQSRAQIEQLDVILSYLSNIEEIKFLRMSYLDITSSIDQLLDFQSIDGLHIHTVPKHVQPIDIELFLENLQLRSLVIKHKLTHLPTIPLSSRLRELGINTTGHENTQDLVPQLKRSNVESLELILRNPLPVEFLDLSLQALRLEDFIPSTGDAYIDHYGVFDQLSDLVYLNFTNNKYGHDEELLAKAVRTLASKADMLYFPRIYPFLTKEFFGNNRELETLLLYPYDHQRLRSINQISETLYRIKPKIELIRAEQLPPSLEYFGRKYVVT